MKIQYNLCPIQAPSTAPPGAAGAPGAVVKITGIPASMTGSSIFDCLQQSLVNMDSSSTKKNHQ